MMDTLWQDLRYAMRQLAKRPGFTLTAVITLALGIGANSAIFSVINATVLEPLPYAAPDRLVRVREVTPEGMNFSASEPNYLDFRDQSRQLEQLAAFKDHAVSLTGQGEPVRLDGLAVTHDFFAVLGVAPALGRGFLATEDLPGADSNVVLLSHGLWQQRFGGDRGIVGREIILDGKAHLVVGVMPADFRFMGGAFWRPLAPDARADRGDHWLGMIGRLAPGASLVQAEAELRGIAERIGERFPPVDGWSVRAEPLSEWLVGPQFRLTAYLLFGAVGFLLLLACVNLANLQFVRANLRQAEIGIRAALGAERSRLLRQLLTETLLLSLLGVVAGLLVAGFAVAALQGLGPENVPRLHEIRIDGRVLGFTLALGLLTGIVFGLAPAWRASRVDVNETLRRGGRSGASREHRRLRDVLVVVQIALAMLLLVGAGLLIRSFMQLQDADPGFDPEHVLAVQLQLGDDYAEPWQKVVFFHQLMQRLEAAPGITAAGATAINPFSGGGFYNDVTPVELAATTAPSGYAQVSWRTVTPGFFDAIGVPLLSGRLFTDEDPWNGPRIVVITQGMAEKLWPGENAIGKELYWGGTSGTPLTVIGVVGNYHDVELGASETAVMFVPHNQLAWPTMTVLARSAGDIAGMSAVVREQIRAMDPDLPIPAVRPLEQEMAASVAGPRFRTWLLGVFALVALLLAAVGVYGVMAFNVSQRTREVGLRMAMGAPSGSILRMLLTGGARLALAGIGLGLVAAFGLARFMQGLLYETAHTDPLAIGAATALLAGVAFAATWFPARRAALIEPSQALRQE